MKIGSKKGFTLIELLVVIAIIGILAVALLPTILGAPAKGRDTARKAQINAIATAIEANNLNNPGYPVGLQCLNDGNIDTAIANVKTLMQGGTFPKDPLGANGPNLTKGAATCANGDYLYGSASGLLGKNYFIASYMELKDNANATWNQISSTNTRDPGLPTGCISPNCVLTPPAAACAALTGTPPVTPAATTCMWVVIK